MKYNEILLQLLRQTSEPDETPRGDEAPGAPLLFVDLGKVVSPEAFVVLPLVSESVLVPGPDELQ